MYIQPAANFNSKFWLKYCKVPVHTMLGSIYNIKVIFNSYLKIQIFEQLV